MEIMQIPCVQVDSSQKVVQGKILKILEKNFLSKTK